MQIIRFYANWCKKCELFSDKERLEYDIDADIDDSVDRYLAAHYQISTIPSFVALYNNGKIKARLINPKSVEEYLEWKKRITRR